MSYRAQCRIKVSHSFTQAGYALVNKQQSSFKNDVFQFNTHSEKKQENQSMVVLNLFYPFHPSWVTSGYDTDITLLALNVEYIQI